jgi:transcriptional regulator with XRE-family HTH domain
MQVTPSTEISAWLLRARDELGLSRQALATAAGVSPATLRNAELNRHRITRQTATRLMQEIAKRDALLAYSAPTLLLDAGLTEAQRADRASLRGGTQPRPVAQLRFQPIGSRALLQLELDQHAVRRLVGALGRLLSRGERSPSAELPGLHLVLTEKK